MRRLEQVLSYISSALLLAMTLLVTADVIGRMMFRSPIYGTLEVVQFAMVGIVFLALPRCESNRAQISVTTLTERSRGKTLSALKLFGLFISFVMLIFIMWRSAAFTWTSWQEGQATMGLVHLPEAPAMLLVPIGASIACARIALLFYRELRKFGGPGDRVLTPSER